MGFWQEAYKVRFFACLAVAAVVAGVALHLQRSTPAVLVGADADSYVYEPEPAVLPPYEPPPRAIMIYITGEVNNPGVFNFYGDARVADAVAAAGGLTAYADPNSINKADWLFDTKHIIVFALADAVPPGAGQINQPPVKTAEQQADGRININTATSEQLQTLSGIGPVIAGNIIRHREERGGFLTIEEIMNVSGIGEARFANIRDMIKVDD